VAKGYAAARDCVLLVEGYFDLLILHQHGVNNSVATLGTALTLQHIRTLKRYTKNLITVFDADSAGIQATLEPSSVYRKGSKANDQPPQEARSMNSQRSAGFQRI
jgi:DNA primase